MIVNQIIINKHRMNINDFKTQTSTVNSVMATNDGTEFWVQHENEVESVYLVQDESFRAREGHRITAICYGRQVIALRNDNTYTKIQLMTGADLLGPGPEVRPKSGMFWLLWAAFISCPGIMLAGLPMGILNCVSKNIIIQWLGGILSLACYLAFIFVPPWWFIARPRLLRRQHQQNVKAADAAIAALFNPL